MTLHDAAASGFAAAARRYDRGRPGYPEALDRWLREAARIVRGKTVIELGAGTGKFLPRLIATGATVVAIEPVDSMRARLVVGFPDVDVRAGSAGCMPLSDASVDAVVCAQAFHWFANATSMAEIARVLRPGGTLALIWNIRDETVPWMRRLTDTIAPYEGDAPRHRTGDWRHAFPALGFGPLRESRFDHVHVGPPERVIVDRFLSISFVAALPDSERDRVERSIRRLIAEEPALAGQASVRVPYETVAYVAERVDATAWRDPRAVSRPSPDAAAAPLRRR